MWDSGFILQQIEVNAPDLTAVKWASIKTYCTQITWILQQMYCIVSQVIEGKDIAGAGFQTFGYSINGGLDVDSNSYPDVLVGSLDDRVVLLRLVDSEVG